MKRLIPCLALIALVGLVGCSGDSPSADPVPTAVPTTWGIESLTVSDTTPFVGSPVLVDVEVTKDGSAAPDGTSVEFASSGPGSLYGFTSGVLTKSDLVLNEDATVITEGGVASVFFAVVPVDESDDPSGSYLIQARVSNVVSQTTVAYGTRPTSQTFQLLSVNPQRGPYAGGQVVTLFGYNISTPVEVYFIVNGRPYLAEVTDTIIGTEGWIQVLTPAFAGQDWSIEQTADIRVSVSAGSTDQQTDTLFGAYTLLPQSQTADPVIFGVNPTSGRSSGGEIITIFGQEFGSVMADTVVEFVDSTGTSRLGSIVALAPDGTQVQVETPRFSTLPLAEDEPQDVVVTNANGSDTLFDGFIVLADEPEPTITAISPTSGPLDGGTLVTIFGSGFQVPMQVWFGDLTALDVNVFNDTTPADNDRITCVTPDYSQQDEVVPVTVDVKATNMTSGKEDTLSGAFTYGDELYISGNSPSEGGLGDLVIIYGSGFEDPLQVFLSGEQMEVVSVSGTELVVRIPDDLGTQCAATAGAFEVILLESNRTTTGGSFTIRGNTPTVLSVDPIIIQESDLGTTAADITITGQAFAEEVIVTVGAFTVPSIDVDRISETTIDVEDLPRIDQLGITFETSGCMADCALSPLCTAPVLVPGERESATSVSVGVTNFPGDCTDTLPGAIVIEPDAATCTPTPVELSATPTDFGATHFYPNTTVGFCTLQTFTVLNNGGQDLLVTGVATSDGVVFPGAGDTCTGSVVPWNQSCSVQVQFCPSGVGGFTGGLTITYSDTTGVNTNDISLAGNGVP